MPIVVCATVLLNKTPCTNTIYALSQKHYGIKTNYLVLLDEQSKEVVSKSKISEEIPVSIKEDADGYYFVPEDQDLESQLYSQFKKYCCHK